MEKEELLRHARALHECSLTPEDLKTALEQKFPELKESEDERIRKELWEYFHNLQLSSDCDFSPSLTIDDILAYLERQKERKPAESISQLTVQGKGVYKICPRCKERMVRDDSKVYTSMPPQYGYECPKCGEMEFDTVMYDSPEMEEQKSTEWSEEDEKMLIGVIDTIKDAIAECDCDDVGARAMLIYEKELNWLENRFKSLHPQPGTVPVETATKFGDIEYKRGVKDGIQSEKKPSLEAERGADGCTEKGGL